MNVCPFTGKNCLNYCQLYMQGQCAIAVIAKQQENIAITVKTISQNNK